MNPKNFIPFPVLITEKLTLRQLSSEDLQSVFALRSNEEVNKYLGRQATKTHEEALAFIHKVNDNIKNNNSLYWAITVTETGAFVGTICLFDFSDEKNSCEIGYELMPSFQRKGIMKEAAEKVIAYAFQTLRFRKIVAFTHTENLSSTKLLEKFNFIKSTETFTDYPDLIVFTLTDSGNSPDLV